MNKNKTYRYYLLLIGILGAVLLSACQGEELLADNSTPSTDAAADVRPLVEHTVSVAIDGTATRVAYQPLGDGLQLSWKANENLGVYIYNKTNSTYTYAGSILSTGTEGDRGVRHFTGTISAKNGGETYIYIHPFIDGETQGSTAHGHITLTTQSAALGSTTHLSSLIPLIWHEGSPFPTYHGYALHLSLAFNQDPGTITSVTLQTMDEVGTTAIFPAQFDAATMTGGSTKNSAITLNVTSGTATKIGSVWTADAYLACTNADVDVFRTKFNVKVETGSNGTFYNEYRSFPGQEQANADDGLAMLANGKCYNLGAAMSEGAAPTIISTQYKVNSLLGMWNEYGKSTDPFHLVVYAGGDAELPTDGVMPQQLKDNKDAILLRYISQIAGNGTPTWLGPAAGSLYATGYSTAEELKQADVTVNNIEITQPTEVFVTFISEFGWNENLLGYYYYSGEAPSSNSVVKTIIFPNVSKPNHQPFNLEGTGSGSTTTPANIGTPTQAPLREFETVKLLYTDAQGYTSTTFPKGTTIGFMMMIDTEAQENSPKSGYDLLKWSQWRLFTNTKWNTENSKWLNTYANNNFFASGDVCNDSGAPIPGLAIYGVKDNATNTENTAYGAMIFMVSTKVPEAMKTYNKAYFNIGTGPLIVTK